MGHRINLFFCLNPKISRKRERDRKNVELGIGHFWIVIEVFPNNIDDWLIDYYQ